VAEPWRELQDHAEHDLDFGYTHIFIKDPRIENRNDGSTAGFGRSTARTTATSTSSASARRWSSSSRSRRGPVLDAAASDRGRHFIFVPRCNNTLLDFSARLRNFRLNRNANCRRGFQSMTIQGKK
jgi:hypothetical protein